MTELAELKPEDLVPIQGVPLLYNAKPNGQKATDWAGENKQHIERIVAENGALLIRGLKILSSRQFGQVLSTVLGTELLSYQYRSTPRTELRGNIYTATEYHASESIPQHNENSYTNRWPMRLGFLCLLPANEGGETPIADSRKIYDAIDPGLREEFERRHILYVRTYGDIDLPWSEVFQTEEPAKVEQFCRENGIEFEWKEGSRLRTWQINPAVASHPVRGERVWFNQAHLFHMTGLRDEVRESLLAVMDESELPRNTYFGDGGAIPREALDHIREVYEQAQISFPWQRHDLLLLDNMLFSHGRRPFAGNRKVLVGMGHSHGNESAATVQ